MIRQINKNKELELSAHDSENNSTQYMHIEKRQDMEATTAAGVYRVNF